MWGYHRCCSCASTTGGHVSASHGCSRSRCCSSKRPACEDSRLQPATLFLSFLTLRVRSPERPSHDMQSYEFRGRSWPAGCCLSAAGLQNGDFVSVYHKVRGGGGDGGSTGAESRSSFLEMYATKKAAKVLSQAFYSVIPVILKVTPRQCLSGTAAHFIRLTVCTSQSLLCILLLFTDMQLSSAGSVQQ